MTHIIVSGKERKTEADPLNFIPNKITYFNWSMMHYQLARFFFLFGGG